jgi:hypothetical protein
MKYFEPLDIGCPNILTVDTSYLIENYTRHPFSWIISNDMVDPGFLTALEKLGIGLREINLKCSALGLNAWPIHRDEGLLQDQGKINWVINDTESPFVWYRLRPGKIDPTFDLDGNAIEGVFYDLSDMEVACEQVIGSSTVVQTGVPHSVQNVKSVPRFNVQVCLRKDDCLRPTFDQVLDWVEPMRR